MDYTIIEPCCAERQVSRLLAQEHKGRAVMMQTNGDVALKNWMQAVLLLASSVRPRVMTLAIGEGLTEKVTRILGKYLRLEWVAKLRLMTPTPLTIQDIERLANACECSTQDLLTPRQVTKEMAAANSSLFTLHSSFTPLELAAEHPSPQPGSTDDVLMMEGELGTVIIQGRMTGRPTNTFTLYTGLYGKADNLTVRHFTDPFNAHFRARLYEVSLPSSPEATSAPEDSESPND